MTSTDPRQTFAAAVAHHRAGRLDEAEALYRQVLARAPNQVDSLHLLGVLSSQRGDFETAVTLIKRAIAQKQATPVAEFHNNIGIAYNGLGRRDEARRHFSLAVRLKPGYAEACNNLGALLNEEGDYDGAEENFRRALASRPDYAKAYFGLGNVAFTRGRLTEALSHFDRAIALEPTYAEAYGNSGRTLLDLQRVADAEARFLKALSLRPDMADSHYSLGVALADRGAFAEARAAYDRAIQLNPAAADAHWNMSHLYLREGDFARGWEAYEWRLRRTKKLTRDVQRPRWDGRSDLKDRTILIQTEQGYGDTFQFIRYAALVKDRGATVLVECQPGSERLLAGVRGIDGIVSRADAPPHCDLYIELMSLPHLFATSVETVPREVPYIFAPADVAESWQARTRDVAGLKVGAVWRGNLENASHEKRSIPADIFTDVLSAANTGWFSLQRDAHADEIAALAARGHIEDCGPLLNDWAETAGLISAMDLVITVDTGVAHLAGAMGKPAWVLLPHAAEWRWLELRADSPWYPSARLFRQSRAGDWHALMIDVRGALESLAR